MGLQGMSLGSLIIIGLIAILLFGTKRLRQIAEDLGITLRHFNRALKGQEEKIKKEDIKSEN